MRNKRVKKYLAEEVGEAFALIQLVHRIKL